MIWKKAFSLAELNDYGIVNMMKHLAMEFTEIGNNYLVAKMPVDERTQQPMGLLHGGASVALAETLGSCAANLCLDAAKEYALGLEINANHIRSVKSGYVYGKTSPVSIGKKIQIWRIEIRDDAGKLVCESRITMVVMQIPQD